MDEKTTNTPQVFSWCSIDGEALYKNCSTCWRSSLSSCRFKHDSRQEAEESLSYMPIPRRRHAWCSIDDKVEYKKCSTCWRFSLSFCRFQHASKEEAEKSLLKTEKVQEMNRQVKITTEEQAPKTTVKNTRWKEVFATTMGNLGLSLGISALGALVFAVVGPLLNVVGSTIILCFLALINVDIFEIELPHYTFGEYYLHAFLLILGGTVLLALHPDELGTNNYENYEFIEIFHYLIPIVTISAALFLFPGLILFTLVGLLIIALLFKK